MRGLRHQHCIGKRDRGRCLTSPIGRGRISRLARNPGEGLRHLDRPYPLTPTLSRWETEQTVDAATSRWFRALPLHERLFDHEMAGGAVAAFGETACFEHLTEFFQHGGAAAHHDPVGGD